MNQKKEKSKIWLTLFCICLGVVILASGILCIQYLDSRAANKQLSSLQEAANEQADASVVLDENADGSREAVNGNVGDDQTDINRLTDNRAGETAGYRAKQDDSGETGENLEQGKNTDAANLTEVQGIKIPEKNLDWDKLHEENGDIYAWIYVPDTTVDYPVLQHPTDNSYYLNHNMNGTKGYPGCIYTENFNSRDFSDIHTVIYGHNLKDKSMFSTLHNFEDEELFGEDHYIFLYTEENVFVYRIFAAYEFSAIHLLDNFDYTNEYVYEDYLKKIYQTTDRVANVRTDIQVTAADKIVTLSTCTEDHDSERRFLVTGVLVNP
ncbi:MAG: class B sortase [Muribaculaceae bacterium]|nr:class B sortase [Muribaculaceae bacterium]